MLPVNLLLPLEPPVDIGRDAAAEEARHELSKPVYNQAGDSLFERAVAKLMDWIAELFTEVAVSAPGGSWGLLILLGLIVLAGVVVVWRAGVLRTTRAGPADVFGTEPVRSAAEYRAAAEGAAARGELGAAIRSRFRACVGELTERTVLDDRAGRTAFEVVTDAGAAVPALNAPLRPAARVFAEVVYGDRPATAERYAVIVAADDAARKVSTRSLVHSAEPLS